LQEGGGGNAAAVGRSVGGRGDDGTLPKGLTVLRAHELEVGRNYYILLSNYAGLYRYHLGDVVRVVDYVETTPRIEFLSPGAHTCSLTGEKLTEHQVVTAVSKTCGELGWKCAVYVVAPVWTDPPGYRFYFEQEEGAAAVPGNLAEVLDRQLQAQNIEYASKRKSGRLAGLRVHRLERGTLTRRDRKLLSARQGYAEQFKHRFLLNQPLELP